RTLPLRRGNGKAVRSRAPPESNSNITGSRHGQIIGFRTAGSAAAIWHAAAVLATAHRRRDDLTLGFAETLPTASLLSHPSAPDGQHDYFTWASSLLMLIRHNNTGWRMRFGLPPTSQGSKVCLGTHSRGWTDG